MVSAAGTLPRMLPPPGRPWVIAHRGASAAFPENTLAAFRGAAALGADAVELDARRTADGAVVVHHDAVVPGVGAIVEQAVAVLRRRAPQVPSLAEALEACAGMWVDVEVKNSPADPDWDPADGFVARVLADIEEAGRTGTVLLTSFNPATITRARVLAPNLATGWLVEVEPLAPAASWAAEAGHAALLPRASTMPGPAAEAAAAAAHRAGIILLTWTVDDPAEAARLAAAGLDGIITNRPDAVRSALGEHHDHHGG